MFSHELKCNTLFKGLFFKKAGLGKLAFFYIQKKPASIIRELIGAGRQTKNLTI